MDISPLVLFFVTTKEYSVQTKVYNQNLGMGKVYHPNHPIEDDGALSWSLDKWKYFHPTNFSNKIADLPDNRFQDGQVQFEFSCLKSWKWLRVLWC